jgi:nitrogen-specific signal transduction histidine kinase
MEKKYYIYNCEEENKDIDMIYNEYYKKNVPINNLTVKLIGKKDLTIKYLEINSNPILNRASDVLYTILTIKDVTESKIHQINAEEQAAFVRNVVNTIDVPIAVLEYPELKYKLINKKYDSMMRYMVHTGDSIVGQSVEEVFFSNMNENLQKILFLVGEKGNEYTYSPCSIIDEKGNERFYKFKFMPYRNLNDNITRVHIHGLDITEEVNHNIELEKVTKLKDEFFTVISHELRTPLTIIYSSLQLVNDIYGDEITPNINKTLFRINQNCSRLLKLINNILDLSKAEAGFLELNNVSYDIVYVTEFIVNSVNLYAKSKGIELIFDTNEEECEVNLDKDKYEKILLNILSNAIKFTPEGKQILVELLVESENVTLKVKDQGIGIPENKIDFIFDRFAQVNTSLSRRAEGTGIGLSLVKKLVELMEGNIKVKSKEGKGTEFSMIFKKQGGQTPNTTNLVRLDSSMGDKIHIEFSDIN